MPKTRKEPTQRRICGLCDTETESGVLCAYCASQWPPALLAALETPGEYAMEMRSCEMVHFRKARVAGEFVHLEEVRVAGLVHHFRRGIDVRLADVVWCADLSEE